MVMDDPTGLVSQRLLNTASSNGQQTYLSDTFLEYSKSRRIRDLTLLKNSVIENLRRRNTYHESCKLVLVFRRFRFEILQIQIAISMCFDRYNFQARHDSRLHEKCK